MYSSCSCCWVALKVWPHFLHSCRANGRTWGARLRNWTRRTRATCRCQSSAPFLNLPTSFWTKTKSTTWWVTSTKIWPEKSATPSSWTKRLSRSRVWVKAKCHNTCCRRQLFSQCSVPTCCRHQAVRDQKLFVQYMLQYAKFSPLLTASQDFTAYGLLLGTSYKHYVSGFSALLV